MMKIIISTFIITFFCHLSYAQTDNYFLGLMEFDNQNFERAVELLQPHADSGKCMAQYAVGFCYSNDELSIHNDSLSEHYLLLAAEQKHTHAMGLLASLYFGRGRSDSLSRIKASAWAELAAEYDDIQKGLTTRHVIRRYLSEKEIKESEEIIEKKKEKFNKMENCAY
jgi:TPR repeat protein